MRGGECNGNSNNQSKHPCNCVFAKIVSPEGWVNYTAYCTLKECTIENYYVDRLCPERKGVK